MQLRKEFYFALENMIELKAVEVRDFVASSKEGKEMQVVGQKSCFYVNH